MLTSILIMVLLGIALAVISKIIFKKEIRLEHLGIVVVVNILICVSVYSFYYLYSVHDTEIWNGKITDKVRDEGSYERVYPCNCTTDANGNTSCQTCSETIYTVDWYLRSTVGEIPIDRYESSFRTLAYSQPDPTPYVKAAINEACSKEYSYTNYIKAAKTTLFDHRLADDSKYDQYIPAYPSVHSYYKVNRVFAVGFSLAEAEQWNSALNDKLIFLGPNKQANVILFVTSLPQEFKLAVEHKWLGGKKNDIVIFLGTDNDKKNIKWVDAFTYADSAGNYTLINELKNTLLNQSLNHYNVILAVDAGVTKSFIRKEAEEFRYLIYTMSLPMWAHILLLVAQLVVVIGLVIFSKKNNNRYTTFGYY